MQSIDKIKVSRMMRDGYGKEEIIGCEQSLWLFVGVNETSIVVTTLVAPVPVETR